MLLQTNINIYYMRQFFIIFALFTSLGAAAQSDISNEAVSPIPEVLPTLLKPEAKTGNLNFSWPVSTKDYNSTWEIQGAKNGKGYKTVGIIWGTQIGSSVCEFKEAAKEVSGRFDQYRLIKYAAIAKN